MKKIKAFLKDATFILTAILVLISMFLFLISPIFTFLLIIVLELSECGVIWSLFINWNEESGNHVFGIILYFGMKYLICIIEYDILSRRYYA